MSELCSCNCGSRQFERLSEKIICSKCKKDMIQMEQLVSLIRQIVNRKS